MKKKMSSEASKQYLPIEQYGYVMTSYALERKYQIMI